MELKEAKRLQLSLRRQMCEPITDDVFRHILRQLWRKKEGPAQVAKLQLLNSTVPKMLKRIGQSHVRISVISDSLSINKSKINGVVPISLMAARFDIYHMRAKKSLEFVMDCASTPITRLYLEEENNSGHNKIKIDGLLSMLCTHRHDHKVRVSKVFSKGGVNLLKNLFRKPENALLCVTTKSIEISVPLSLTNIDGTNFATWFRFPRDLVHRPQTVLPLVKKIIVNGMSICSICSTLRKNVDNILCLRKMFPNLRMKFIEGIDFDCDCDMLP
uniref:Uncharacterized protein n=1 Tax=Plectus sambesii TaxID=2011161 RepID=A0A914VKX3_9BILA